MATKLLKHPRHDHPLVPWNFRLEPFIHTCDICRRKISSEAYTCRGCKSYYYHRACVKAPPQIEHHPLHPVHPLALTHGCPSFKCDACKELFHSGGSSFHCKECEFNLDLCCALSTLSDLGGGEAVEQISIPLHPHPFTLISKGNDFVGERLCVICLASIDEDGYMCLARYCEFVIHKRCIQDLYYADGTKAPRIYHGHPLEIFVGEDMGSSRCGYCASDESGEFIGCPSCQVFYHRDCIGVPENLQYPPHPDHTLVLFINRPDNPKLSCGSCSDYLEGEFYYHCTSCDFLVHVRCALQIISYCEEGMSASIRWAWHKQPLLLCHKTKSGLNYCDYCGDELSGPSYTCCEKYCEFLLHERCSGVQSPMIHPHHPQHPLTLRSKVDETPPLCNACCKTIVGLNFFCESCDFVLHSECATHVFTQKNYFHEHNLLHLDEASSWECNRCGICTDSSFFRCVQCNFNLHEKCMDLPRVVVNSKVHWHPLTLHETYIEDESGEYYCDQCEKSRDGRLGVYVCLQCPGRWTYHVECIIPELRKVFEKKGQTFINRRFKERIARKDEEIRAAEVKLEEVKRELDEPTQYHHHQWLLQLLFYYQS